jgi:hypothetical protein
MRKFQSENMREIDHFGDLTADGRKTLKPILKKYEVRVRVEFIWLRTGSTGGLL